MGVKRETKRNVTGCEKLTAMLAHRREPWAELQLCHIMRPSHTLLCISLRRHRLWETPLQCWSHCREPWAELQLNHIMRPSHSLSVLLKTIGSGQAYECDTRLLNWSVGPWEKPRKSVQKCDFNHAIVIVMTSRSARRRRFDATTRSSRESLQHI